MTRILICLAAFLACAADARAQTAVGFGRAASGGGDAPVCHVRDEATLRACLAGANPAKIVADAALTVDPGKSRILVGSNKTLDGGGRLSIVHDWIGLELNGSRNVIIRGVRFRGSGADIFPEKHSNCAHPAQPTDVEGCGVGVSMDGATANVWIDHNSFEACGNKCIDGWGRAQGADPVSVPDLITISNNVFRDSYYAILFGVAAQVPLAQMPPRPGRVTLYGNLFERIARRAPRAASGYRMHVFNNVIADFGGRDSCRGLGFGFGPSVVSGAQMLLEDNVIEAWPGPGGCKAAVNVEPNGRALSDRGVGLIRSQGNRLENGATAGGADAVFHPDYSYSPLPAGQVEAAVRAEAGVRAAP